MDPTGDLNHQDPILPDTLGLKATTESKKYYMKKSCDADKYRKMTG